MTFSLSGTYCLVVIFTDMHTLHIVIVKRDYQLRNECFFFLGSWGMNRSAGQTNRVNREAVPYIYNASNASNAFIPYIYNASNKDLFLKFFDKSY